MIWCRSDLQYSDHTVSYAPADVTAQRTSGVGFVGAFFPSLFLLVRQFCFFLHNVGRSWKMLVSFSLLVIVVRR